MATKKQIAKEIGKDIGRGLARAGKSTLKGIAIGACKASYPILGNLSRNLQEKIEKTTKGYYNTEDAFETSLVTNLFFYSGIPAYLAVMKEISHPHINPDSYLTPDAQRIVNPIIAAMGAITIFGFCASVETLARIGISEYGKQPIASLPGKIVSLPFDLATYAYDAGKRYVQKISERIDRQEMRQRQSDLEQKAEEGN